MTLKYAVTWQLAETPQLSETPQMSGALELAVTLQSASAVDCLAISLQCRLAGQSVRLVPRGCYFSSGVGFNFGVGRKCAVGWMPLHLRSVRQAPS